MVYIEQQRKYAIALRNDLFHDIGGGQFMGEEREFVLGDPKLNLWSGIRDNAIYYFNENHIHFWDGSDLPTGHLLSSQIACVNHLFFIRQREDIATKILKMVDPSVKTALAIDSGYLEFEMIGGTDYLKEKSRTRGANATSVDAMMLAELKNGTRKLFVIEWKYTESYRGNSVLQGLSGKTRMGRYLPLLLDQNSPIIVSDEKDAEKLFIEPYYQLMRQTLLAQEMVKAKEYGATDYLHLHIIPEKNKELKQTNTSPQLQGGNLETGWTSVLKQPEKYLAIDPKDFLEPANGLPDTIPILEYLRKRYWN